MTPKKTRKIYTEEFKQEAIKLAAKQGIPKAATELGVYEYQLYDWRAKFAKKASSSQREADLAAEVAKLQRQLSEQSVDLAILKKAVTYFAKNKK